MQNERSGARRQQRPPKVEEVLSPVESAKRRRGRDLKRYVRAAAALNELYDDTELADATEIGRGAVLGWWKGARISTATIHKLAKATGLSRDELVAFVHYGGPAPTLPDPALLPVLEGIRRDREHQADATPDALSRPPARRPRDSGAEHE